MAMPAVYHSEAYPLEEVVLYASLTVCVCVFGLT